MQIAFFSSDSDELPSHQKGKIFEKFARRLVEMCGYQNISLRVKRASLEYDIEATSKLTRRQLNGEAKAHESAISGKEAAAFIGKLLPIAAAQGGLDGLFLSTSEFTPDGRDYLESLPASLTSLNISIRTLVGQEIIDFMTENSSCIDEFSVRTKAKLESNLEPLDSWFVVSQSGDLIAVSCGPTAASAATCFLVFDTSGNRIDPTSIEIERLKKQIADLQHLEYLQFGTGSSVTSAQRLTLPGVLAGIGWFDYKFPSPPEYFIGRTEALNHIINHFTAVKRDDTSIRAIQVLSRSGVGKSSLLLKVASSANGADASVTVDGRNLLTPSDLRLAISGLIDNIKATIPNCDIAPPLRQEEIAPVLGRAGEQLSKRHSVATVQIDQFEALLLRPQVFQGILDLIGLTTEQSLPIVWLMARKNDLAATYDESAAVDLSRLNELSHSIELNDFSIPEEKLLISQLSKELGSKLSVNLNEAILTFSAGFPWLLKRVCAHILGLSKTGIDLRQLSQGGLRAEDLFDEDLAGLDEADKALLRTLAANLPNTVAELNRRLEGEVSFQRLTEKLNEFLGRKLLRLSGNVYDTYNDVFKSYLLTNRIPFQSRYVFRVTPGAALGLLPKIADEGPVEAAAFAKRIGGNSTAVYNKLRELRLLGFINPEPGMVALSSEASAALESEQIGNFLRSALRANALAARVLDHVAYERTTSLTAVADLLQAELPHITVSAKTWGTYSAILVNWLRYAGIVDVEGDQIRQRESVSDLLLFRREFNLGTFTAGTFVPSTRPSRVLGLIESLRSGAISISQVRLDFKSNTAAVIRDARSLNLVEDDGSSVWLTAQGRALVAAKSPLSEQDVAVLCLSKPNVRALIDGAASCALSKDDQREILARFGSATWSRQTWNWRVGILTSWLVATGQAKGGRKGLRTVTS